MWCWFQGSGTVLPKPLLCTKFAPGPLGWWWPDSIQRAEQWGLPLGGRIQGTAGKGRGEHHFYHLQDSAAVKTVGWGGRKRGMWSWGRGGPKDVFVHFTAFPATAPNLDSVPPGSKRNLTAQKRKLTQEVVWKRKKKPIGERSVAD